MERGEIIAEDMGHDGATGFAFVLDTGLVGATRFVFVFNTGLVEATRFVFVFNTGSVGRTRFVFPFGVAFLGTGRRFVFTARFADATGFGFRFEFAPLAGFGGTAGLPFVFVAFVARLFGHDAATDFD